jgi:hypothetical protein
VIRASEIRVLIPFAVLLAGLSSPAHAATGVGGREKPAAGAAHSNVTTKPRGRAVAIDQLAADAFLLASLCQTREDYGNNPYRDTEEHVTAAQSQYSTLLREYGLALESLRRAITLPEKVRVFMVGGIIVSDHVWFDPVDLMYLSRGSLPQVAFRYPPGSPWQGGPPGRDEAAGYRIEFSQGSFTVLFKDGMEAKTEATRYVFRQGRWKKVPE